MKRRSSCLTRQCRIEIEEKKATTTLTKRKKNSKIHLSMLCLDNTTTTKQKQINDYVNDGFDAFDKYVWKQNR